MKKYNKIMKGKNKKAFLITGDSMCAIKALFEKQPVLFKKYYIHEGQRKIGIYFYDPATEDLSREYLILKHAEYFNKTNLDKNIEYNDNKLEPITKSINLKLVDDGKIEITIEGDIPGGNKKQLIQENYVKINNFFELYKFFVVESSEIIIQLNTSIQKIKETQVEYNNIIEQSVNGIKLKKIEFAVILSKALKGFEEEFKNLKDTRETIFENRKIKLITLHNDTVNGFFQKEQQKLIKEQGKLKAILDKNVENIDIVLTKYIYLLEKNEGYEDFDEYIKTFYTSLIRLNIKELSQDFTNIIKKINIIEVPNIQQEQSTSKTATLTANTPTPTANTPTPTANEIKQSISEKIKDFMTSITSLILSGSLRIKYLHYFNK
jgi:hypothetical protein